MKRERKATDFERENMVPEYWKPFKGKAIYSPKGKASEYAKYACNFYVGCSNGCTYCYCKKGILAGTMGCDTPTLKKCFKDENHALEIFEKELKKNLSELQKHGLFFSFTTDPMLSEMNMKNGEHITIKALAIACYYKCPVKILTKRADILHKFINPEFEELRFVIDKYRPLIAIGFTLTGHDELEPNASPNEQRIEAMKKLHDAGFKTFASIEPVINFESSYYIIIQTLYKCCDLYKIGLESGKKYDKKQLVEFMNKVIKVTSQYYGVKIYFKDSLLKQAGINREDLPDNCVGRDYNIFNS
ncbi:hypothetical protein FACS189426_06420 [Bacteroidia bacterium]|nr:hypothetical protein FACS189426_06420 [Bacteroidia bacterium]